jgi:phosphoserine phosphatase
MTRRICRAIVLTARPGDPVLTAADVERVQAVVPAENLVEAAWLAAGEAWQMLYSDDDDHDPRGTRAKAMAALGPLAADVNIVADDIAYRRKKLLVADMESTIIEQEMLDELADFVGLREKISSITERAMRGELEFEAALKERVGLLAGLDAKVLDEVAERITLMPGADLLISTLKADGCYCVLVSGGFTVFTERIAHRLGFDEHQANVLEIEDGRLTGRVKEPILGREAKLMALNRLASRLGLHAPLTMAVGDGANDLAMLEAAGLGVAFRAKPKVREAATAFSNGAVITHGDLTGLLYLQGYQSTLRCAPRQAR